MQPNNKMERTKAFINFLLLFVLSLAIIMTTVFFSIQVPVKQANDLRKQIHRVEIEHEFSNNFFNSMSEILGELDSINNITGNTEYYNNKIADNILNLQRKVDNDSIYNKILYQLVVKTMSDLQTSKTAVRKTTGTDKDVKELQKEKNDLIEQYNKLMKDYSDCLKSKS